MRTQLILSIMAATLVLAPAAQAGHKSKHYGGADESFFDEAKVVRVEPIVRTVQVTTPRRECWEEAVYRPVGAPNDRSAGKLILGGVAGGVIGSQLGKGHRNRDAATLAGTVIGVAIAHDMAHRSTQAAPVEQVDYVQRCRVTQESHTEERVDGYDVTYRYQGELFTTRLPYDPGKRLRVRVAVTPVRE